MKMLEEQKIREAIELKKGVLTWRADRPKSHFKTANTYSNYRAHYAGQAVKERDEGRITFNRRSYRITDVIELVKHKNSNLQKEKITFNDVFGLMGC